MENKRRTFLVGLGRFMMGAAALSIVKPPVLYSFPSEIRIATDREVFTFANDPGTWIALQHRTIGGDVEYTIDYHFAATSPMLPLAKVWAGENQTSFLNNRIKTRIFTP